MWQQYAGGGRGFVVAFDTTKPSFNLLGSPGRFGKVEYTDKPIPSFLSGYGPGALFRKRTQYEFEAEWRSIRAFTRFRLEHIRRPNNAPPIYLSPFDPSCIKKISIRKECAVEWELRTLAAVDARYRHVAINFSELPR
jgi:hypothetical protein